jgi:hypothetical protein
MLKIGKISVPSDANIPVTVVAQKFCNQPPNFGLSSEPPCLGFCAVVCFVDRCLCLFYRRLVVEENSEMCQSGFPIANGLLPCFPDSKAKTAASVAKCKR